MKIIFAFGLLIAAVAASPITEERFNNLQANFTHLWKMVHDMEEHHGDGVHIHLQTNDDHGGHTHQTSHLSKDGKDSHVYLHMDVHDEFRDLIEVTENVDMDHDHDHMKHGESDGGDDSEEENDLKMGHGKDEKFYHHHYYHHHHFHGSMKEAHCDLMPAKEGDTFKGHIHLKQLNNDLLSVHVDLDCPSTMPAGTKLGLHVHEGSDLTNRCDSLGGHFNPHSVQHGARASSHHERHAGDWGNVVCDSHNEVESDFYERLAHLTGPHSIMNRSIVLHVGADDHGEGDSPDSKTTGDAGSRMACCIIKEKMDDHH